MKESVWADLRKKSLGQEARMENDVNHMNFDEFTIFVTDTYSEKGNWFQINDSIDKTELHIDLDIINGISLKFNVSSGKLYNILIDVHSEDVKPLDVSKLENDFKIEQLNSKTYEVRNLDDTVSNSTYVKLIEFFIENKDNLLMESVWGDMRRKSLGQEKRIEEDVDRLSYTDFLKYLQDTYVPTDYYVINAEPSMINSALMLIRIPIEEMSTSIPPVTINYQIKTGLYKSYDKEQPSCVAVSSLLFDKYPELMDLLKDYDVEIPEKRKAYVVDTKAGPMKNSDCVNIIDIVLSVSEQPLYIKKKQS